MSDPGARPLERSVSATFNPVSEDAGGAIGAAVQQLGEQGEDFGEKLFQVQQQKDLSAARLKATQQLDALNDTFRTDTAPDTMPQRFNDQAAKIGTDIGAALTGQAANQFNDEYGLMAEAHLQNVKDMAFERQRQQTVAGISDTIETNARSAAFAANQPERDLAIGNVKKAIAGGVSSGMVSATDGQEWQKNFDERLALFDGKNAVFLNPTQALKNLADGNYLPQLDPLSRVELQHSAEAEVRVRQREAAQQLQMNRLAAGEAAQDLQQVVAAGGHPAQYLIDNAKATAIASRDPRAQNRVVGLLRAIGFADALRGAPPREVDAEIMKLQQQAQAGGMDDGMATALTAATKFKETMNTQLAHDPLMWGQTQGIVNVQPLQLNGTDTPQAFQQRMQQARGLSQRYGVPVSPLTQAETETVKTNLASDQGTATRMATLNTLIKGFGADAPHVLARVGSGDPAVANAGALVAGGSTAAANDVLNGSHMLSSKVNDGLRPSATAMGYAGIPGLLGAYAMLPDSRTQVLAGAQAIYAARAPRQGLSGVDAASSSAGRALLQRSLQEAAGARFDADGSQWGGIGQYRGAQALVPAGVKADGFEDLMHHMTPQDLAHGSVTGQPPAWEGGAAPDNLIHRTWLISGGNGVYGLSTTNPANGQPTPLRDAKGQAFNFRFGPALVSMQARTGTKP